MKDTVTTANSTAGEVRRASARERLLQAANELFYEEGVHTVGIDRVIERAGVAKASLYSTFGSKDELIRAYLTGWARKREERVDRALERAESPREGVLAIFDILSESTSRPTYHGCAFMNASAEASADSPIVEASDQYREWLRGVFTRLARDAGAPEPDRLGRQLHLLYDGATVSARMDHDVNAAATARVMAEALMDAALSSTSR
jgi:AcrR family transcriptional regulator